MSGDYVDAAISIAYPIEHIPPRGRVAKISWQLEVVPVLVRTCSEREMRTAFLIERKARDPIRVASKEGDFLWPVGSGGRDSPGFLSGMRLGYREVVGLVGARLRTSYQWTMETNVQSREVIHSWRDEAVARAHRAAESIFLVEGYWPHIRGGVPAMTASRFNAFNTGFEYGRPQPVDLTGEKGVDWLQELNLRSNVANGHIVAADQSSAPASVGGQTVGDKIRCEMELPPFDVALMQARLLCRDLIEGLDENHHVPLDVRRNGFNLHRLDYSEPGFDDCVNAIIEVRAWLAQSGPALRHKFHDAHRLLRVQIPRIDESLRRQGRPSAFTIETTEDEAVASLFIS